jgi:Ca2+:H+ antiporter
VADRRGDRARRRAHRPGIGGFLNASFGNAPELIIALFAVNASLPEVVRGSLAGSVVSNILLVLGVGARSSAAHARHGDRSTASRCCSSSGSCRRACSFPRALGARLDGDPERHSLAVLTIPVALVLLFSTRRHDVVAAPAQAPARGERREAADGGWTLPVSLVALGAATVVTALISETLVHSLDAFAHVGGHLRVLHRRGDRRDRRQRGRARRRDRDRARAGSCRSRPRSPSPRARRSRCW